MVSSTCVEMDAIPNINDCVSQAVKALSAVVSSTQKAKNLFSPDDGKILLTLDLKKLPVDKLGYTKVSKIPLPHSVFNSSTSVCLFVKDISHKPPFDDENSTLSVKELLEKNGVARIVNEIIPLHQLRTELKPFEAKRNLCHSHDLFLADDRIAGHLPSLIGKEFWKSKKLPVQVNLKAQDLSKEFAKVLGHTYYHFSGMGSLSSLHVANDSQNEDQILDNIKSAICHLCKVVPGGLDNIRGIHLKKNSSSAIPIYLSTSSANDIELKLSVKRRPRVAAEELSTKLNTKVKVYPDGYVRVLRDRRKPEGSDDESEDEEDDCQDLISSKRKRSFTIEKTHKTRRLKPKKRKL